MVARAVRVPAGMWSALVARAEARGVPVSWLVRAALEEYLVFEGAGSPDVSGPHGL